ncbi:hypothetical protein D6D05_07075 [Aureobasidium pullulans]|nr:hypothetical protein D6D05_07075 [Aureobasidium pullulans]
MILARGGDLNRELDDSGKSALHVAAATFKCRGAIEVLLEHGAAVNAIDMYGQTALHKLVTTPCPGDVVEIAEKLINNDAVMDAKDFEGKSVLDCVAQGLEAILRILYEEHHGIRFIE